MGGVAGQLVKAGRDALAAATLTRTMRAVIESLRHRGPDGGDVWTRIDDGVALGHRRLALGGPGQHTVQPVTSRSGRWTLTLDGQIYNHRELRGRLESEGARFVGSSDAETVVEALDAWGVETTLTRLDGMFAFGAWDSRHRLLELARDRFGEKPLCWTNADGRFAFASEVQALTRLPRFDRRLDDAAATSMLRTGAVAAPRTIYRAARHLLPGHRLTARLDGATIEVREQSWWSLTDEIAAARATPATSADASEELAALLEEVVTTRLHSDVPLGVFLSGGVDSAVVAALATRATSGAPLQTFAMHTPGSSSGASVTAADAARAAATHIGAEHHVLDVGADDLLSMVPFVASAWDEPFGDPSMLPALALSRAVRSSATVWVSGVGGDELFAGYGRHALVARVERATKRVPTVLTRTLGRALSWPSASAIDRTTRALQPVLPKRMRSTRPGEAVRTLGTVAGGDARSWERLIEVWPVRALGDRSAPEPSTMGMPRGLTPLEHMLWLDTATVLPNRVLVAIDRASMSASLQVRAPLLSPALLRLAWRQPVETRASGSGKAVFRSVAERMLPAEVAQRPQAGFDLPLAAWLRGPLRPWAEDMLSTARSVERGWLDGDAVASTWSDHRSGRRDNTDRLWSVLMLEQWLSAHR